MEKTTIISNDGNDHNMTQNISDPMKTAMPGSIKSINMECIAGNTYAISNEPSKEHVLVQILSMPGVMGRRTPLNIALVIDKSGSMEGDPLDYVKRACCYVVDLLEPNDILSVVTFEEQVEVLVPARRVVNKNLLKEHINRISAGNTTNLYDGLVLGCNQAASVMSEGYVNRVILFTDGEPTAGIKDFQSIVGQVTEQKSRGITVTALGFGLEYNEELLASIARRSNGNYYYISKPELIQEVFRKEMESLMTITARNMKLVLNLSKWVQLRKIYGHTPVMSNPRRIEIPLVDLDRGSAMSVLGEFDFLPRTPGIYRVIHAELSYDDASSGRMESIQCDVEFNFVTDKSLLAAGKNPLIAQELEIAQASINLEKTVMGMKTQQISSMHAAMELQKTMNILASQGRTDEAEQVRQSLNDINQGIAGAEKTLIGVQLSLDQGKKK